VAIRNEYLRDGILKHMTKKATLLWMDLEMTGLDPVEDRILEVAAIATDWDLKEIATYEAVKKVGPNLMKSRMVGEFWDKYSHVRDALTAQNLDGKNGRTVENELLEFITEHFDTDKPVILAGNSIHQDRKFIDNEWHRLSEKLHYRMLDVTAWKVVMEGKYKKKFAKPEQHRALEDIRGSIEELQYYLGKVKL
jgi:oligoribonuclease